MHPVFWEFNGFFIYWYGIMVASAVFICGWMFQKMASQAGYPRETISGIIFWTVLWGIIGARVLHILVQIPYYYRRPLEMFMLRDGGLAAEGAILAGLVSLYIYSRIKRFDFVKILDILVIPATLGHAIGRIGCFLNGCCFGKETSHLFGVQFPKLPVAVHPTQLYYTLVYLAFFCILLLMRRHGAKRGVIASSYLLAFGATRFFVDRLRGDLPMTSLGLYATQIIAIFVFMAGILFLSRAFSETKERKETD